MSKFMCSEIIHSKPSKVFDVLTEPYLLSEWVEGFFDVEVLAAPQKIQAGVEMHFLMKRFKVSQEVHVDVLEYKKGQKMILSQKEGLFEKWSYSVFVRPQTLSGDREATLVREICDYQLPMGLLGNLVDDLYVRRDLENIVQQRLLRVKNFLEKPRGE